MVRMCPGPGHVLPGDDDGPMVPLCGGLIDDDDFMEGLEDIAKDLGIDLAAWDVPGPPMTSLCAIARLRINAPRWSRAAAALDSIDDRRESVSINALADSARVGLW